MIIFTLATMSSRLCPSVGRDARATWPGRLARSLSFPLATALSGAYLLHLICDAISGGINGFYPVHDLFWGDYWVHPYLWVPIDIVLILLAYYLLHIRRHYRE